jgi:hypothetical protein
VSSFPFKSLSQTEPEISFTEILVPILKSIKPVALVQPFLDATKT